MPFSDGSHFKDKDKPRRCDGVYFFCNEGCFECDKSCFEDGGSCFLRGKVYLFCVKRDAFVCQSLPIAASVVFLRSGAVLLFVFWGTSVTAFNVSCQAEIIRSTDGSASAVAMSIFSGIFNMGIAPGTMLGGTACTHFSIADIGFAGAAIALPAAFARVAVTRKANAVRS